MNVYDAAESRQAANQAILSLWESLPQGPVGDQS